MHRTTKALIAAVASGLALAPSAFADTNTADLVLARDACGAAGDPRLSFDLGAAVGCGNLLAATGDVQDVVYPTPTGTPLLPIDGTRAIHVAIRSGNFLGDSPRGPIGDETVRVELSGKKSGSTTTTVLGTATRTTPAVDRFNAGNEHTVEFDLPIGTAQAGTYKSLALSVYVGGALLGGYISHDGTSLVTLPVADTFSLPEE